MSDLHGRDHLPALLAELSEARAREWREQHQVGSRPELLRCAVPSSGPGRTEGRRD